MWEITKDECEIQQWLNTDFDASFVGKADGLVK